MPTTQSTPPLDVNAWRVLQMRLTAFRTEHVFEPEQSWWQDVVGESADRTLAEHKKFRHVEEGGIENGLLRLRIQPIRIDWLLDIPTLPEIPEGVPALGTFPDVCTVFSERMERWLPNAPEISRMAFAARLFQPANDREAAYEVLSRYLPSLEVDPRSRDLQYQVNRRRPLRSVEGLQANRLSKWSVAEFTLRVELSGAGVNRSLDTSSESQFGCVLELDINTLQERTQPLPHDKLTELFRELRDLGIEIAATGDVA